MLRRPPATNRRILVAIQFLTGLLALSFLSTDHVELTTFLLLTLAAAFLLAAAIKPYAALVFAGFGISAVAFASRAILGQLMHDLDWQQRVRLFCVWTMLAWSAGRRAREARHILRGEQP